VTIMPRPDQTSAQRARLLPIVARTFAELGFRRATTAELARRCAVRENILYRLWKDKKEMFLASIDFVYDNAEAIWETLARDRDDGKTPAERLLAYEADHHGEFGLYRLVFAGLTESDDPEIRRRLVRMYRRFHRFVGAQIAAHRTTHATGAHPAGAHRAGESPDPETAAWGLLGLGTLVDIARELRLAPAARRREIFTRVGRMLLEGAPPPPRKRARR